MQSPIAHIAALFNAKLRVEARTTTDEEGLEGLADPHLVLCSPQLFFRALGKPVVKAWDEFYDRSEAMTEQEFASEFERDWAPKQIVCTTSEISTENLAKNWFRGAKWHDAYGSATITTPETGTFNIFNDYGEESEHPMQVAVLCVLRADWVLEVARLVYNFEAKTCEIRDYRVGEFPPALRAYPIQTFTGKRAFYYCTKQRRVDLRVPDAIRAELPRQLWASSRYDRNVSGKRVTIPVRHAKLPLP